MVCTFNAIFIKKGYDSSPKLAQEKRQNSFGIIKALTFKKVWPITVLLHLRPILYFWTPKLTLKPFDCFINNFCSIVVTIFHSQIIRGIGTEFLKTWPVSWVFLSTDLFKENFNYISISILCSIVKWSKIIPIFECMLVNEVNKLGCGLANRN